MKRIVAAVVVLHLAACSQGNGDKADPAATKSSASPAAASPKRLAGSWMVTTTTTRYVASGLPPAMAGMAEAGKASIGKKDVGGPVCLTEAKAADDTLDTRLQEAIRFGPEWKVARKSAKDGKVDFVATMEDPAQGKGEMTITGEIAPDRTTLRLVTISQQPGGPGRIETEMLTENRRVGDCKPGMDEWQ